MDRIFQVGNKTFPSSSKIKIHDQTHSGEKPFDCTVCPLFPCTFCDEYFVKSISLKTHMKIHADKIPYPCPKCTKPFSQSGNLRRHMRIHTGEKPYLCPQCGQVFSESGNLKSHKRTHKGDKPFTCSSCDKSFTLSTSLKDHSRIHTGEKPFPWKGKDFFSERKPVGTCKNSYREEAILLHPV